ncbi:MAG: fructokinase [Solirubrobacteraceae bacterium]
MGGTVVSFGALAGSADNLILVGGEALYDLVLGGDEELRAHPGGGPFNAARTIARLEQPVAYLGRLSSDRFGATLRRMLSDDGVLLDAVVQTDDPTTLALAEVGRDGSAVYRFYERCTSAPGLTPEAALAALPAGVGLLHVGTLGFEPMSAALEAVVDELAGRALVAVDPNVRPGRIADPDGYRARLDHVIARSDLVKVSEDDLAWMDPDRDAPAAARALLDRGPAAVLLTLGAAGALVVGAGGDVEVPAPAVKVVDTIGAGDAFGGAFLAWWRSRGLPRDRLTDLDTVVEGTRFATLVAAITCTRPGASPPRLDELP